MPLTDYEVADVRRLLTAIPFLLDAAGQEARVESVEFTSVASTTTEKRQQTLASDPIEVEYGSGAAEIASGDAGDDTFMILTAGVYQLEWVATIAPGAETPSPCLEIQRNSDNAVLALLTT